MLGAARLRADYERLRADALSGGSHSWRYGRALLAHSGLPAWLAIWSEHAAAGMTRQRPAAATGTASATAPAPGSTPLVSLLALMLLAHADHAGLLASGSDHARRELV